MTSRDFQSYINNGSIDIFERMVFIDELNPETDLGLEADLSMLLSKPERELRSVAISALIGRYQSKKHLSLVLKLAQSETSRMVLSALIYALIYFYYDQRSFKEEIQRTLLTLHLEIDPYYENLHKYMHQALTITQRPEQMFWKLATNLDWKEEVDWELLEDLMPDPNVPKREITK